MPGSSSPLSVQVLASCAAPSWYAFVSTASESMYVNGASLFLRRADGRLVKLHYCPDLRDPATRRWLQLVHARLKLLALPSFKLNFTVMLKLEELWLVSCHHMWHASCRAWVVTSQRRTLEQEQHSDETVAMEMLSGTGVGLDEDERCEHEERQHTRRCRSCARK
jgi:hypothetical protein